VVLALAGAIDHGGRDRSGDGRGDREQASYNGGILDLPGVKTVIADGRNFVDRSDEQYSLIYLNIVYSQAAAPRSAGRESHLHCGGAAPYWRLLAEDGRIGIVTHNALEGVRLLMTALAALQQEGMTIPEALSRTALVMTINLNDPTVTPSVLIVKRRPWTQEEAETFSLDAARRGMQPMFIPHRAEDSLKLLLDESVTFQEYLALNTDYNIFPRPITSRSLPPGSWFARRAPQSAGVSAFLTTAIYRGLGAATRSPPARVDAHQPDALLCPAGSRFFAGRGGAASTL
jgi:uncharacterized protein (DUF2132 family)